MRTKAINYVENTVEEPLGYIGEHNETQLLITPPTELAEDTDIVSYSLAFGVNGKTYHSATVVKAETFTVDLWQEITQSAIAYMQIEGYDANGDILAKSKVLSGKFLPSVKGTEETADFTPPIIAEIAANTAARHTHSNKAVLDELGEDENGDLTYKGDGLATDSELALKQDILTAGANITITGTTISADIDNTREIAQLNNPYVSVYTPAQLKAFDDAGLLLTYTASPILWAAYDSAHNEFHFAYAYPNRNNNTISYYCDCYVNASKTITLSTARRTPYSVNTKTPANATGDITLVAGDISAASGWTPSADTDLATKKYVDDNAGGTPDWSDIQNKPNFATVATSGDYDDLLNKPTIPAAQEQADWNEADNTKVDYIKNKPTIPSAGTITSGSTGYAVGGDVYTALQNVSVTTTTVTLAAADWSANAQTVTVTGVTATNLVMVAPAPSNYTDYGAVNIRATAQATDSLTFECGTTPSADIDVNVAIWG